MHAVNDRLTFIVDHQADLYGRAVTRRPDEHRHREVIGCERSPVVPVRVQHVVVENTVLACTRLDVRLGDRDGSTTGRQHLLTPGDGTSRRQRDQRRA